MGTDSICTGCPRTTLFSNPKIVRYGKPFGKADCCDNARVIRDVTGRFVPRLTCRT